MRPETAKGPTFLASYFEWGPTKKPPNLAYGGLRLHRKVDGLYQVDPPRTSPACEVVASGDATKLFSAPHLSGCVGETPLHASAQTLQSVLVGSDGEAMVLVNCVDEALGQREICRASTKAAQIPIAGTSAVSASN